MKRSYFIIGFSLLANSSCRTTGNDGNVSQIERDLIEVVYVDKTGLRWTADQGSATNGCESGDGVLTFRMCTFGPDFKVVVQDSNAAKVCLKLGSNSKENSRLPTRQEYDHLITEFDHSMVLLQGAEPQPVLTESGVTTFKEKFRPPFDGGKYWTSSLYENGIEEEEGIQYINAAYTHEPGSGTGHYYWNRAMVHSNLRVRCVLESIESPGR